MEKRIRWNIKNLIEHENHILTSLAPDRCTICDDLTELTRDLETIGEEQIYVICKPAYPKIEADNSE